MRVRVKLWEFGCADPCRGMLVLVADGGEGVLWGVWLR